MKAVWNKNILAESDKVVELEGNIYFPRNSVREEFLEDSPHRTECPWKGTAYYYNLNVDGSINENAAWFYPEPKAEANEIRDHIAFWKGVTIEN